MKKTFWIRPIFLDDDWRCLRRSRLLTVDMSAELEVHYIYIFWLIGMSFSSRRRNYLLTSHRRDGLIEWYAHQKCTSAVLCGYPVLVTVGICTVSQVALATRAFRCGEWGRNRGARGTAWGTWWTSSLLVVYYGTHENLYVQKICTRKSVRTDNLYKKICTDIFSMSDCRPPSHVWNPWGAPERRQATQQFLKTNEKCYSNINWPNVPGGVWCYCLPLPTIGKETTVGLTPYP